MAECTLHFGIDTSNYTSSAAAVSSAGEVFSAKRLLTVPAGNRGLRQSDALFCHTRDLGEILAEVTAKIRAQYPFFHAASVGVSDRPRNVEGSYMPCFLAGVNAAKSAALIAGVPLFLFSHQEGHIEAAKAGCAAIGRPFPETKEFFAFHLSGGTGELLRVFETDGGRYQTKLVSATLDITVGQFIDRCGVRLGLSFPAGKELEKLAAECQKPFSVRIAKDEQGVHLSGLENQFEKLLAAGESRENLAGFVFAAAEAAILALLETAHASREELPILFSGGVASSFLLKDRLARPNRFFAPPEFCADNAIGIALLSKKQEERNGAASHYSHPTE